MKSTVRYLRIFLLPWSALLALGLLIASPWHGCCQNWTLTSAPTNSWACIASSADGKTLVAAAGDPYGSPGAIYSSTNGGASWVANTSSSNYWTSVASSADGTKLVAVAQGGPILISTNSGLTWSHTSAPVTNWASVASSADGTKLVAAASDVRSSASYPGLIYTSTNAGNSWVETTAPPAFWSGLASSADGVKLVAVSKWAQAAWNGSGQGFTSTNSGLDWKAAALPGAMYPGWLCTSSSADGTILAIGGLGWGFMGYFPCPIDISSNSGATWALGTYGVNGGYGTPWNSVCSSADGQRLAATQFGALYASTNAGSTWSSNGLPINSSCVLACSADGSTLVAGASNGGIYTWQTIPSPALNVAHWPNTLRISWIVPSMNFALEQSPDMAAGNWADVAVKPTLNYTNLHYEVNIAAPLGTMFYRLQSQ